MVLLDVEIQNDKLRVSDRKGGIILPLNPRSLHSSFLLTVSQEFLKTLEIVREPIHLFGSNVYPRVFPKIKSTFFATYLDIPMDKLELVYLGPQHRDLPVNQPPETAQEGGPIHTAFVDSAPYSLVAQSSLNDFNNLFHEIGRGDIRWFRPNIIVSGTRRSWDEDDWKEIVIGGHHKFYVVSRIPRCEVIK